MFKYKKGQRVKLKKLSEELLKYKNNPGIVPEMVDYFGKCVTIDDYFIWKNIPIYSIEEDTINNYYDERWFEKTSNKLDIE